MFPRRLSAASAAAVCAKPHKVSTNDPAFYKSGPGDLVGRARPLYSPTSGSRPREKSNILWFKSRSFFVFYAVLRNLTQLLYFLAHIFVK